MPTTTTAADALLTRTQLADQLGVSYRETYRMEEAGRIPAPIVWRETKRADGTKRRTVRWLQSHLDSWKADGCPTGWTPPKPRGRGRK